MKVLVSRFFTLFCLWSICCTSFPACPGLAADDWSLLYQIPSISASANAVKRTVSGFVLLNGSGLADVVISDGSKEIGKTDSQGFYQVRLLFGLPYTLTPSKAYYTFSPPSISIPAGKDDLTNKNFTATKQNVVTVSGNLIWKNTLYESIPSNPLTNIPVEAYQFTDCYDENTATFYARSATNTDGNYTLVLPVGWCGYVEPYWESGVNFYPGKMYFWNLKENQVRNFETPWQNTLYTITVVIRKPNGDLLPLSDHFYVYLEGTAHAYGTKYSTGLVNYLGECYFSSIPHGFIGKVTPTFLGGTANGYTFKPTSIQMLGILSANRTFTFTATQN